MVRISKGSARGAGRSGASLTAANQLHACDSMIVFCVSLYPNTTIGSAKSFKTYG